MLKAVIQKAIQYVVDFVRAAKYSILIVAKASMFDDLDRMPDVKTIQRQFLFVFSALLLAVNIVAFLTINVYLDDVIDTIRNAVCDRLASIPHSHSACFENGYVHLLQVEKAPTVDAETLATSIQLLWEALALSQAVTGYAPWAILPKIFDYVVLPLVIPAAAGVIVWFALLRKHEPMDYRERIRRYATYLMMSSVAVPLLLLAPVQALDKTFERAERNFRVSDTRLTGTGYNFIELEGKYRDEASAIAVLRDLVYRGGRTTTLVEYGLYALLALLSLRMVVLLRRVIGKTSVKVVAPMVGIFAALMALVL
jgi:hypothetical protein